MKASKFIVLVGGILGLVAFFLPAINVKTEKGTVGVSAMQMVAGIDLAKDAVDKADAPDPMSRTTRDDASADLSKVKGIVMGLFAPALLLVLIGGIGAMRRRFGRGMGALSLLFGLISLGIGALVMSAAEGDTSAGIAITMLVVTGIAGFVGGMLALIKPDRGMATA